MRRCTLAIGTLAVPCGQEVQDNSPFLLCGEHIIQIYTYAVEKMSGVMADDAAMQLVPHPEPWRKYDPSQECVYFLRFGNRIKIGFSHRPEQRARSFHPDEILHIEPGGRTEELAIHKRFAHLRIRGEWFDAVPELLEFIAARKAAA